MKTDKSELISVIEKTIYALENNTVKYDWTESLSCNCGILSQQVCSVEDIEKILNTDGSLWTGRAFHQERLIRCNKTGEPINKVFKTLFDLGMNSQSIQHLENLTEKRVLDLFDENPEFEYFDIGIGEPILQNIKRDNKKYLIKYLKAWRDLLIEESQPEVKTEYKLVFSDQKVKQLVNEKLILS